MSSRVYCIVVSLCGDAVPGQSGERDPNLVIASLNLNRNPLEPLAPLNFRPDVMGHGFLLQKDHVY